MIKGLFKRTGNPAVDMVAACINHYERQGKTLAYIRLHPIHWALFVGFVVKQIPMYDLSDGEVDFDGVKITEGSTLMIKAMYWEENKPQLVA